MTDGVKFDPGIGELIVDFNSYVNDVYSQLMSFRTIHQKRARFKLYASKLQNYMKNNIAFYLGCLLWAYYIFNENKAEPKEIIGNSFLTLGEKQKGDYDFMSQVNFMENYFDCFERDMLYYAGQKTTIPQDWKNILSLYAEFLELNNGFINTKMTSDIVLPEKLKTAKITADINALIEKAIEKKDLNVLLDEQKLLV